MKAVDPKAWKGTVFCVTPAWASTGSDYKLMEQRKKVKENKHGDMGCPRCGSRLRFLAGCPAHDDNLYCDSCSYEAWTERQKRK